MVGFQRCLIFILGQVLVQVRVHAFVVILLRVIHGEKMISSELDVDEYLFFFYRSECQ